jgi:hypothetical protein
MATRNLLTVKQFADAHPAFTEAGIRWQIFNEKHNGLAESGAILRRGRRVYIDVDRYFAWLDQSNGVQAAAV